MSKTLLFDDSGPDVKFTGGWWTGGVWAASNGQSGTLSGTNDLTGYASFKFPIAATEFRYYGMKRGRGGRYGICVDCNPNNATYTMIDGFDPSDSGRNAPTLLWSQTFPSASIHSIIITNHYDSRGIPTGNSQLTIDRFELDVPAVSENVITSTPLAQHSSVEQITSPTSSTALSTNTFPTFVPTSVSNTQTSAGFNSSVSGSQLLSGSQTLVSLSTTLGLASSPSVVASASLSVGAPSKALPMGGIIGGGLGGLFFIGALVFAIFWLRLKRRTASSVTLARPFQLLEVSETGLDWSTHRGSSTAVRHKQGTYQAPTLSPPDNGDPGFSDPLSNHAHLIPRTASSSAPAASSLPNSVPRAPTSGNADSSSTISNNRRQRSSGA